MLDGPYERRCSNGSNDLLLVRNGCMFYWSNSLDNGQCTNTSTAANWLSINLIILNFTSISNKTAPKIVQRELEFNLLKIATLDLEWWRQLQGWLMSFTVISSLYLLSYLGVEGWYEPKVCIVGAIGTVRLSYVPIINSIALGRVQRRLEGDVGGEGCERKFRYTSRARIYVDRC